MTALDDSVTASRRMFVGMGRTVGSCTAGAGRGASDFGVCSAPRVVTVLVTVPGTGRTAVGCGVTDPVLVTVPGTGRTAVGCGVTDPASAGFGAVKASGAG